MRRHLPLTLSLLGLGALACFCGSGEEDSPEQLAVEPTPPPPEEPAPEPAPEPVQATFTHGPLTTGPSMDWPLGKMARVPPARSKDLPLGEVVDLELTPDGEAVVALTGAGKVWRWGFEGDWSPVELPGGVRPTDLAPSPFDGAMYAAGRIEGGWAIELWPVHGPVSTIYRSTEPLGDLVVPLLTWDGTERVFFSREYEDGKAQILSVNRGGSGTYEVTSPTGLLGDLTHPDYRSRSSDDPWDIQPPTPVEAESARPRSLDPVSGSLLWKDGEGRFHTSAWVGNWSGSDALTVQADDLRMNANGSLYIAWDRTGKVRYLSRDFQEEGGTDGFIAPPAIASNGRTLAGLTSSGLLTVAVDHKLAPVRFLGKSGLGDDAVSDLHQGGISVKNSGAQQMYQPYEWMTYETDDPPSIFVSIDGLLEVLHGGFEAVFMRTERDVSAPALRAFATELKRSAEERGLARVADIAGVTSQFLDGDYSHADGQAALAEGTAFSELHGANVDFGDFKPRGPYAADDKVQNYFRAFKYMNTLQLTEDEAAALAADAALVEVWGAWTSTQSAFLQGSRQKGALTATYAPPAWVRSECVVEPPDVKVFPLNWPPDSEILDRTTNHRLQPDDCKVAARPVPTGLDLMAGLGSAHARKLSAPAYAEWPGLSDAHDRLVERFGGPLQLDGVVPGWLRAVQLMGTDTYTPEAVEPDAWRSRLLESALASWTSLRHTMVLLNEVGMAEMGGGEEGMFEVMKSEPARGAVDPVPEAWEQLASVLDMLAVQARKGENTERLVEVLTEVADNARDFGDMARRQMKDEPLTEDEYQRIQAYGRAIEHPFVLFKTAAFDPEDGLKGPEPMMKIVDVYAAKKDTGGLRIWHPAVGHPREVAVLLGDRGVLVPARGAIYSYYEVVVDDKRLSDEDWREQVDSAEPPEWSIAYASWSPSL